MASQYKLLARQQADFGGIILLGMARVRTVVLITRTTALARTRVHMIDSDTSVPPFPTELIDISCPVGRTVQIKFDSSEGGILFRKGIYINAEGTTSGDSFVTYIYGS